MDNVLFSIPILTGAIFMVVGFIMLKFPPKNVNHFYGYRTSSSMKSQKTWKFAQRYSAKEMIKLGVLLAISSLIGLFYKPTELIALILGLGLLIGVVLILIYRVEKAIKKNADN